MESTFQSDKPGSFMNGVGIVKRVGEGRFTKNAEGGWMSYWEPEAAPNGHTACAILFPVSIVTEVVDSDGNFLAIAKAEPGKPFVHYFGAGWSKSGDFPDATAWESYVNGFAERLKKPLVTKIH